MRDIVLEYEDGWYFWDETWANKYGPFKTKEEVAKALETYCLQELGLSKEQIGIKEP